MSRALRADEVPKDRPWWRRRSRRRRSRPRLPGGRVGRIAAYGSSRTVVEALIGARGILLAGMLGPQLFGIWALFRLILTYGTFVGLGLLRGLELEVAKARAPEDEGARRAWGRTGAGCTLGLFGLVALAALVASFLVAEPWQRQLLWAVAAGLFLERLWFFALAYLRAAGSLQQFALLELAQALGQIVLTLGLAALFGLGGAFAGFALANLMALALVHRRVPFRPALQLDRLRAMLAIGVPLSITQLLSAMLATVDRLVVGAMLGIAALGQYAFAVSVASLGLSAALIVRTVVFPDVYGRLAREDPGLITRAHLEDTIRPFVLFLSPLLGGGALLLGPLTALLLPQFEASAQPAAVFVFTGVAQGVVSLAMLAVVAARQQKLVPLFTLAALLVNAGLAAASLALGLGMIGLAAGAVVGRLAYAFGVLAIVARATGTAPMALAFRILWPIAWCAAVTFAVVLTFAPRDLEALVWALAAYALGTAPVLLLLVRTLWRLRPTAGRT